MKPILSFCFPVVILSLFFSSGSFAAGADPKGIYAYVSDFIDSIGHYYDSTQKIRDLENAITHFSDNNALDQLVINSFHDANRSLESAKASLEKYQTSTNDLMLTSLMSAVVSYQRQSDANLKGLKLIGQFKERTGNGQINREQFNQDIQKLMSEKAAAIEILLNSAVMVTYLMIDRRPGKDGNISKIYLTKDEREVLIRKLDAKFGKDIQKNFSEDVPIAMAPAVAIREMLTNPAWKTADRR